MNLYNNVSLNFKKKYEEFYMWNNDDNIIDVLSINVYVVSSNTLLDLCYKDLIIELNSLGHLETKFYYNDIYKDNYYFLFTDGKKVIGIQTDKNGMITGRSDLLIDEHNDIVNLIDRFKFVNVKYETTEDKNFVKNENIVREIKKTDSVI